MPVRVLKLSQPKLGLLGFSVDSGEIVKSYSLLSVNVARLSRMRCLTRLTESLAGALRELPKTGNWPKLH